jgi:proteasome lid subunit RPN8/RPN11
MIKMSSDDFARILVHAQTALPNEACGLLAGVEQDGVRTVQKVYLLTNVDASPEHFSMDPREQLAAIKDMRQNGLTPLGNWHSHPDTPSRPSEEDVRLAHDPKASYLILSLQSKKAPNLNAFRVQNGAYEWEILAFYD